MKWGWAIWGIAGIDQAERCRLAAEIGFDYVSFVSSPLLWGRRNPDGAPVTAELLAELGLGWTVHCAVGRCDDPDSPGSLAACLDDVVAFAADAGPPLNVPFDPGFTNGEDGGHIYDEEGTARGLGLAFEKLGPVGTTVSLENWKITSEPECFERMGSRFPELGIILDVGHMNMHVGGDGSLMAGYVKSLPLPIVDLHLHDNDGRNDQHLPLGEGVLDMAAAGGALGAIGYDGLATVEICPHLKALDAGEAGALDRVRSTLDIARSNLA